MSRISHQTPTAENGKRSRSTAFQLLKNGILASMSATLLNTLLRLVLSNAKLETTHVSTHSFRIGGTTFASSVGISADCLKAQGNWPSDCYETYVAKVPLINLPQVPRCSVALTKQCCRFTQVVGTQPLDHAITLHLQHAHERGTDG